jgi:hypothetical protein
MKRVLTAKKLLFSILFVISLFSAALVYKNNTQPELILSEDITYYLPGQNNNCRWILQAENNIRNIPGESSHIRIGIPEIENRGYIAGRIEVGSHKTLILAFIPPGSSKNKTPVILIADYSKNELPIKSIRFRWNQSSALTILLFSDQESCKLYKATPG